MKAARVWLIAVALVVSIGATACGGGGGGGARTNTAAKAASGTDKSGDDQATKAGGEAGPAAASKDKPASNGSGSSGLADKPAAGAANASNSGTAQAGDGGKAAEAKPSAQGDEVDGKPMTRTPDDPTPSGCTMQRGSKCLVRMQGIYTLTSADAASIRVAAFDDGSKDPASSTTLPNAKKGHSGWYIDHFPYIVSATAKQVTFQATLLSATGQVLAEGQTFVVPIP